MCICESLAGHLSHAGMPELCSLSSAEHEWELEKAFLSAALREQDMQAGVQGLPEYCFCHSWT